VPTDGTVRFEDDRHRIISSITKRYKKQDYFDDESSLGYAIDVFAESINTMHTEYLVNMIYLERIMRDYGFELLPAKDTQRDLFLPRGYGASMGSFRDMFDMMTYYVKGMTDSVEGYDEEFDMEASLSKRAFPENHPMKKFRKFMETTPMNLMSGKASEMTDTMKAVSFVNNYFVFKKVQHIDAKTVSDAFIKNDGMVANAAAAAAVAVAMVESGDKAKEKEKEKGPEKEKEKESRVRKQIDGVVYVMDTETGELFKTAQSKDPIGKLKISSSGKRKEIECVNDEYAAKHQLQKEKAAESSEKKRKPKDVEGTADK
jgi:ribosomal protein L12E/L44/L45/RPP1/RPP2